jgi:hypothetical protein
MRRGMLESLGEITVGPETTVKGLGLSYFVLDEGDGGGLNMGRGEVRVDA